MDIVVHEVKLAVAFFLFLEYIIYFRAAIFVF